MAIIITPHTICARVDGFYCHKCNDSMFGHMLWALNAQIFALTMRTARFNKYFLIPSELDMPYGAK